MDMAVDDDLLVNSKPMMEEPLVDYRVYPIPDTVPDENLERFFQNAKSKLEKYGTTITLNAAEQTLTFVPGVSKWNPGPALNKYGKFEITTFTVPFPENRATKLKHVWPDVEEFLYEFAISCNLNLAECSMQVSTTTFLDDPYLLDRARHLLQLLSTSLVPPYMALEIFQGSRQHEIMEIGDQQGGLCTKFGVKKGEYLKRWECLFYSLKALSKATQCHIFLNENTFTAVTAVENTVERISWLRSVVGDCITKNLCPATSIRKFGNEFGMHQSMDDLEDPHAKHMEMVRSAPFFLRDSMPEVCSLYTLLHEKRAKLLEASSMLESSLSNYGISCTLEKDSMAFTTTRCTKEPDIIDKALQLLELLSTTHVPVSLAIEILDGSMQTCVIKIGNQEGGICSDFGISEEEYLIRWECLRHSLQVVAETAECNVFLNYYTVAAVGNTSLELFKQSVENCFLHNLCPGTVCTDYNSASRGLENIEDPHVKHMEMEKSGSSLHMLEVSSFCTFFSQLQATQLYDNWSIVESCLQKHDISCKLVAAEFYMTVSVTTKAGESNISDKILDVLKLLSVGIPPSKAIQVLEGSMYYDFIRTGSQYGGFCLKYGIA
ncbi:uncharacterized protein LOC133706896 isoform X2 [Rosa rugosa]|uniref:uncharacterized protein LOC133706896 isoform X2 n=1 Tax=Rosa rugosa TaxID=74645 RepID=UPI002B4122F7|nr:uncharacterized protein LOC133706896 isoform X2 [Rosa rugosa]